MVQGRSWYTKWWVLLMVELLVILIHWQYLNFRLTVLEKFPIYTRFKTYDFTDLGGSLNVRVQVSYWKPKSILPLLKMWNFSRWMLELSQTPIIILIKDFIMSLRDACQKAANHVKLIWELCHVIITVLHSKW